VQFAINRCESEFWSNFNGGRDLKFLHCDPIIDVILIRHEKKIGSAELFITDRKKN
jgi:hypothetical protein